jgi:hypothetical protein
MWSGLQCTIRDVVVHSEYIGAACEQERTLETRDPWFDRFRPRVTVSADGSIKEAWSSQTIRGAPLAG